MSVYERITKIRQLNEQKSIKYISQQQQNRKEEEKEKQEEYGELEEKGKQQGQGEQEEQGENSQYSQELEDNESEEDSEDLKDYDAEEDDLYNSEDFEKGSDIDEVLSFYIPKYLDFDSQEYKEYLNILSQRNNNKIQNDTTQTKILNIQTLTSYALGFARASKKCEVVYLAPTKEFFFLDRNENIELLQFSDWNLQKIEQFVQKIKQCKLQCPCDIDYQELRESDSYIQTIQLSDEQYVDDDYEDIGGFYIDPDQNDTYSEIQYLRKYNNYSDDSEFFYGGYQESFASPYYNIEVCDNCIDLANAANFKIVLRYNLNFK